MFLFCSKKVFSGSSPLLFGGVPYMDGNTVTRKVGPKTNYKWGELGPPTKWPNINGFHLGYFTLLIYLIKINQSCRYTYTIYTSSMDSYMGKWWYPKMDGL